MTDRIDALINRLKVRPQDHDLTRLESAVWQRIEKGGLTDSFGGRTVQVQLFVTCGALLVGLAIAQFTGFEVMSQPLNSEIVVLSDDSALAPSVRLEGGI
jgi:hypothetical protein